MAERDSFELEATFAASAMQVLSAFLDAEAVKSWWPARLAIVQPRPGGLLVIEREVGKAGDDPLLGSLGGHVAGTLDKAMAGHFVCFGNLHWLSPRGEVFGPTRLEVSVFSKNDPRRQPTVLRVRSSGYQAGERWQRFMALSQQEWDERLARLRTFSARQSPEDAERLAGVLGTTFLAEAVLKGRHIS
jgi:uncharacterized protein YndB with AHSA1/START domain